MTGRQRCDEILRLIDEALMQTPPPNEQRMSTPGAPFKVS